MPRASTDVRRFAVAFVLVTLTGLALTALPSLGARAVFAADLLFAVFCVVFILSEALPSR